MAAPITPSQLNKRADFYHQLASLTAAGVPIIQSLESVRHNPPARSYIRPIEHVIHDLEQGSTFAEALERLGGWMPAFDLALFAAGEKSGRLDQCMRILANYYKEQAVLAKRVFSELAYPFFVLHMAVAIFPISSFTGLILQGQTTPFIVQKLTILLPLYTVFFI